MNKLILGLCAGLILLGVTIFIIYIKKMLSGKCCEGCKSCSQKNNCRNFDDNKIIKK